MSTPARNYYPGQAPSYPADQWDRRAPAHRHTASSGIPGWAFLGAAAVAGALAWYYLGPDLRRYLKIRSM